MAGASNPLSGLSSVTGGASSPVDFGGSATSGDVYSTTNSTQGGLTLNNGLSIPPWGVGVGIVAAVIVGGVWILKQK